MLCFGCVLQAAKPAPDESRGLLGMFAEDLTMRHYNDKEQRLINIITCYQNRIQVYTARAQDATLSAQEREQNAQMARDLAEKVKVFDQRLMDLGNSNSENAHMGRLMMRKIAGRDGFDPADDFQPTGVLNGIAQGVKLRAMKALGDVVEDKAKVLVQNTLGSFWDKACGFIGDLWHDFTTIFFHGYKEPFTLEELVAWQNLISESLRQIDDMLRNGIKDSLRGLDSTIRNLDGEGQQGESVIWGALVGSYADQFDYFIKEFDRRREYYKDNEIATFYADQISKRLTQIKNLLLSTKSLKDLDAKLDSNKAIIPAIQKNTDNLFKQLADRVARISYVSDKNALRSMTTARDAGARRDYGYNRSDGYGSGDTDGSYAYGGWGT